MTIVQLFAGKIWGGAEQYVLDLGKALQERGHRVVWVCREGSVVAQRLQGQVPVETIVFRSSLDLSAARSLSRILRREQADVLHVHDKAFVTVAVVAKRLAGTSTRILLTRHIARRSSVFPLYRWAYRGLHRIVFVSQLAKRLWQEANPWMPDARCRVVINSVAASGEAPQGLLRKQYGIAADVPLLVFTGRVRRSKGCEVLLRALAQCADLPFAMVFVGACKPRDYADRLQTLAQTLNIGDRVFFHGFTSQAQLLIQDADVGVAPSIVREACPLSPMEFMQAGKCVVATNNGAQPEYISDGQTGLLVPPDDVEALAAALRRVVADATLRQRLGRQAQDHFRQHMSYDAFVGRLLDCYA